MILVDTGPLVALFDPRDGRHGRCREVLGTIREPLATTVPVLTEVFHMLGPDRGGAARIRDFIDERGLGTWFMDDARLGRAFELMEHYAGQPMDLADASLIVAAETLRTRRIFTIDRRDFLAYRIRRGHREYPVDIVA